MPALLPLQLLLPALLLLLLPGRKSLSSTSDALLLLLLQILLGPINVLPSVAGNVRLTCSRHSTSVAAAIQEASMQPSQLLLLLFWRLLPSAVHRGRYRTAAAP